jgi:uncharacterized integral membrane protein
MEKSMKKATLLLWVIIFGFIALVIFQNKGFFLETKTSIGLDLGVVEAYKSTELPIAVFVLIFFLCGIIIAYFFSFSARFKAKRTIKKLNTTIASHMNEMDALKGQINTLKGTEPPVDGQTDTIKLDVNATQKITDGTTGESSADEKVKIGADEAASNPSEDSQEYASKKNK